MKRDPTLTARAKSLRTRQTPPEQTLWTALRAHRLSGVKFTRQVPAGPYILDFAARAVKLAIELDGDTHGRQVGYDAARTAFLQTEGYRVIRFTNADVMGNIEGVLQNIIAALVSTPLPDPLPRGETEENKALSPPGRGLGGGSTQAEALA